MKSNIIERVKSRAASDDLVWKYPFDDLATWTQVVVNESEEAVLFKGGQACDLLGPGRHTLETANIPILSKIVNIPFGGRTPFTAEIWYVKKMYNLDIAWATPSPILLSDPKYDVMINVKSSGQFGIKIDDARKFLTKLVGTMQSYTRDNVVSHFKGLYLTKAKDSISQYLINKHISILEINAYLDELSEFIRERMKDVFESYGITLLNFYVNDISVLDGDASVKTLRDALAESAKRKITGTSYAQERSFDVLEGAAKNAGSSQSGLVGVGMGLSMGGALGSQIGNIMHNVNLKTTKRCQQCGHEVDLEARFCSFCGADANGSETNKTMNCPKCGTNLAPNAKFCYECGEPLAVVCPKCGKSIIKSAKFCPECGTKF